MGRVGLVSETVTHTNTDTMGRSEHRPGEPYALKRLLDIVELVSRWTMAFHPHEYNHRRGYTCV